MIVEFVYIKGVFQRYNIVDGFLFIRFFFIVYQVRNYQVGKYVDNDDYYYNFQ